jgi:hypothetical protein
MAYVHLLSGGPILNCMNHLRPLSIVECRCINKRMLQAWWRQWFDITLERKAISPGTKKSPAQPIHYHDYTYSQLSRPLCRVGNPLMMPENLFFDYPVITSTSRLTHFQFGYARLEQIHVLPARELTPLTYTLNFWTTISLPRPTPVYNCNP